MVAASAKALKDPAARVRSAAAITLGQIGPSAAAGVPGLIEALKYDGDEVRPAAIEALGKIGLNPKQVDCRANPIAQ